MRTSGCLLAMSLLPGLARGNIYGFGSADDIANRHPEFFEIGRVTVVTNGCTPYYVCNGSSRTIAFDRPRMKTIAQLRAEGSLAKAFKEKRNGKVEIRGMLQICKKDTSEKTIYVFAVPVSQVAFIPLKSDSPSIYPITSTVSNVVTNATASASANNLQQDVKRVCSNDCYRVERNDLLAMIDQAERSPKDFSLRIALIRTYIANGCRDEAVSECKRILGDILDRGKNNVTEKWNHVADVSDILLSLGECMDARRGYQSLRGILDKQCLQRVQAGMSKINLKIGIE